MESGSQVSIGSHSCCVYLGESHFVFLIKLLLNFSANTSGKFVLSVLVNYFNHNFIKTLVHYGSHTLQLCVVVHPSAHCLHTPLPPVIHSSDLLLYQCMPLNVPPLLFLISLHESWKDYGHLSNVSHTPHCMA